MTSYVVFDPGLYTNTQYLTEEVAFFLGGIFASEESVEYGQTKFFIAPVRYNYGAASNNEIAQHFELINALSSTIHAHTYMVENIRGTSMDSGKNRMPGFCTFVSATTLQSLPSIIPALREALTKSPLSVRQAFVAGAFDGRSSADIDRNTHKVRMLSLDCISEECGLFIAEELDSIGLRYNYNTHRDRLEGGRPRNPQLRIKDVYEFMENVGLISPRRYSIILHEFVQYYSSVVEIDASHILPGLKELEVR